MSKDFNMDTFMKKCKKVPDSPFSKRDYSDLYFRETFSDRHPFLCAFAAIVLFFAALVGLCAINSVICPSRDYKHEQDAAARCKSLDGNFSYGNLKCYVNGEEV